MNETKATRYQRARRRAEGAGVFCGIALLALLAFTPAGGRLAGWAEHFAAGWPAFLRPVVALVAFIGVVAALWEVALLPAMLYLRARVNARYGRGLSARDALVAQAQAALVAVPAAILIGAAIRLAVALAGPAWWLAAAVAIALLLTAALHGSPALLAQWSGARPIERPALVEQLGALARRVRVPIASIDELPESASATSTALVAGTGESRRVFIAAGLMRDWTDDEIAVVVAHELGHHAHHDLWTTLALDVSVLTAGFWTADRAIAWLGATGAGSPAALGALPLIALVTSVVWLGSAPIRHGLSRRQERQADAFALALTGGAGPFQAAIRRLAAQHLAEERPSRLTRWLFHRHPTAAERLRVAEVFQRRA